MKLLTLNLWAKLRRKRGNTLLIVLSVAAILTPIIWSAVYMASVQQRTVAVSQDWNAAVPIVEAGIELAFAHLNNDCMVEATALWGGTNGWTQDGHAFYAPRQTFPDGSYFDVHIITNNASGATSKNPDIVCVGGVRTRYGVRQFTNAWLSTGPQFAALGSSQEIDRGTNSFSKRQVRVKTSQWGWPDFAQLGGTDVGLNGSMWSFDSQGTTGFYGHFVPSLATADAIVGSVAGNIRVQPSARIRGYVQTSPTNTASGQGSVGDTNWVNGGNSGIQTNHYSNNLEIEMPEIPATPTQDQMRGWQYLYSCGSGSDPGPCTITFVRDGNPTNGVWITTNVNPLTVGIPVPGGYVITNTNDLYFSKIYTTNPAPPIQTFYATNNVIGTNNIPAGAIVLGWWPTNATWRTNDAATLTSGAASPVSGTYLSSPSGSPPSGLSYDASLYSAGVYVVTNPIIYTVCGAESIPTSAYKPLTFSAVRRSGCQGGNDLMVYTYVQIAKKIYQVAGGTNYQYYTASNYLYATTTYSYIAPRFDDEPVTYTYRYVARGGDYRIDNLSLSGNERMLITGGKNRIYVPNGFSLSGKAQIVLAPKSSVEFYMGGRVDIGGNGMANEDDRAANMLIYGLPTCTEINISGNGRLTAGILAPQANISINGGGSRGLIVGSIMGATITSNGGQVDFAHDKDLARQIPTHFYATDWGEEKVGYVAP